MNIAYAATAASEQTPSVSELSKLFSYILQKLPFFFAGLTILVLAFFVAKIVKSIVENKLAEKGLDTDHKEIQVLAGRIAYAAVLTIGITAGLNLAGIDLTSIIAAAAFGIGFALRDLIVNFVAGIMILLGRDFTIGDFIKVNGMIGKIEAIQSRVTILKAVNGTKVIVPNATLFKNNITSFTGNPLRRFDISVPIDYRNNLENAIKILLNCAKTTKGVLVNPRPTVAFVSYGDDGFTIKLKAWCESRSGWVKVRTRLAQLIVSEFDKYGVQIPYTTYNIAQYKDGDLEEKTFVNDIPVVVPPLINQSPEIAQPMPPAFIDPALVVAPQQQAPQPLQPLQQQTVVIPEEVGMDEE